ncbi:MAG: ABC transporter permease [candidate division Zixibacteria bacterium]|nr:ABC transporter permease [candidate division Zixibacteria bacterium]MDH3936874.1 ABC transporter permease [candidate division Zixibacteria bacterium]MDH4033611.1 ABC transporter permease [candidate division Zixibacteria bacterium]
MESGLTTLGRRGVNFVSKMGGITLMLTRFLGSLKEIHRSVGLIFEQLYTLGVKSLPLIVIISVFVGAVSAWQAAYQFKFIGAPLRYLGQAVGKAVVIELAPVLSAIVFAGRVGAGITAELGTMRVTEQIDALESMGINPVRYLVMPRVLACLFMVPFLVVFANFIAIIGGLVVSVVGVDVSSETFLNGFRNSFQIGDFINGMIKAAVFGLIIGVVGCYEGFNTRGGAQGVGLATTNSVVISSVLILVFNFVFALILFRI